MSQDLPSPKEYAQSHPRVRAIVRSHSSTSDSSSSNSDDQEYGPSCHKEEAAVEVPAPQRSITSFFFEAQAPSEPSRSPSPVEDGIPYRAPESQASGHKGSSSRTENTASTLRGTGVNWPSPVTTGQTSGEKGSSTRENTASAVNSFSSVRGVNWQSPVTTGQTSGEKGSSTRENTASAVNSFSSVRGVNWQSQVTKGQASVEKGSSRRENTASAVNSFSSVRGVNWQSPKGQESVETGSSRRENTASAVNSFSSVRGVNWQSPKGQASVEKGSSTRNNATAAVNPFSSVHGVNWQSQVTKGQASVETGSSTRKTVASAVKPFGSVRGVNLQSPGTKGQSSVEKRSSTRENTASAVKPCSSVRARVSLEPFEYGVRRFGDQFYGRPLPEIDTSSFEGKLLGFDKKSYAYVQVLDEKVMSQFELIKKQMIAVYSDREVVKTNLKVQDIKLNELLVAEIAESVYARVRVLAIRRKDNLVLVLDVDEETLHELVDEQLYPMSNVFLQFSFMSLRCKLFGLDCLLGTDAIGTVISNLYGAPRMKMTVLVKAVIPEIVMVPVDCQESFSHIVKTAVCRFNPFPGFFEKNMVVKRGHITNTDENQFIWYQIKTPVLDLLTNLKSTKTIPTDRKKMNIASISDGVIAFAARGNAAPDALDRVNVIPDPSLSNTEDVKVIYTDFGTTRTVPVADLISLDYFDPIVKEIPPQCKQFCTDPPNTITREELDKMKLKTMEYQLYITKVSKDGNLPTAEFSIFFPDYDETERIPTVQEGHLTVIDSLDFAIHKYNPISQNPMSQVSDVRLPVPFIED